ncbi:MAG: GldG family protein [Methylacidiphilales bacterium]|nr:GldG family protein [Candidatus Methylacidiphilales bacterium]MDW8348814.1 GldG family protein [Verrucomicrobiae bacterium]
MNSPLTPHYNKHSSPSAIRVSLLITAFLSLILFVMFNYLGSKFYIRKDLSPTKINELSPRTLQTLKALSSPVTLVTFFGTLNETNPPLFHYVNNLLKEYLARGGEKIKIENVDAAKDLARAEALAKKYNIYGIDDVIILDYQDNFRTITAQNLAEFYPQSPFDPIPRIKAFKGEQQITSALQALIEKQETKVYYLVGHGQPQLDQGPSNRSISELQNRLKRENIQLTPLNLAQTQEIPQDAAALLILGPRSKLSDEEISLIKNYLEKQGRLALFQDPQTTSGLEPLLQEYGLKLNNDIALIRFPGTPIIARNVIASEFADHPSTRALLGFNLNLPIARSITTGLPPNSTKGGINIDLVKTIKNYWGETNFSENATPEFNTGADTQGPLTIAALYTSANPDNMNETTHDTRIIVVGSASFALNSFINAESSIFSTNLISWLAKKAPLLDIPPKIPQEFPLNLTPLQIRTVTIFTIFVLPSIPLIFGILVWFSRRR